MDLSDVHEEVRNSLARGTAFDSEIPQYVKKAARWLEREYNFRYMQRYGEFTLKTDAVEPRVIELPHTRVKSVRFLREVDSEDNSYIYYTKIDPADNTSKEEGQPLAYWPSGQNHIILDRDPKENIDLEIGWWEYTAWPTDGGDTHWLIENAFDVLVAQTMIFFAARLRDPRMRQLFAPDRDEGIKSVFKVEEDAEFEDTSMQMEYHPFEVRRWQR